jgi:glycosyltransferase involved in cell wall biosynthesis
MRTVVIIPALNEEQVIGAVVRAVPKDAADAVIVVDNGSTDRTAAVAEDAAARVVHEPERGYGAACMAGVAAEPLADVFVFLDGDGSDPPARIVDVLAPIHGDEADLVLGIRRGEVEAGAMLWHQRIGNRFMSWLIRALSGQDVHDLPSLKAVRADLLRSLALSERTHGWTAEFIAKAALGGYRIKEVPTGYRRRVGESKVSGSLSGSARAAYRMNAAILRAWLYSRHQRPLTHHRVRQKVERHL